MYDQDVFAILTAEDKKNKASSAFKLPHNARWFRPAIGGVAVEDTIDSREPTPAPMIEAQAEVERSIVDQLVLTFSELMRLENIGDGIQAGTSTAKSHILLGHRGTRGISACQFRIAVAAATDDENDEENNFCIWLHDYHSTHGTAIGYDKQNQQETRVKETWMLAYGPGAPNRFSHITIHTGGLVISIEFPNHERPDKQYLANLRALVDKTRKDKEVPNVQGLGLESQIETQPPSEYQTASNRLIYYKECQIGRGSYSAVYKLIRARDGKSFAAKIFTAPVTSARKRFRDGVDPIWLQKIRGEYTVVKDNPHPNILQVFEMRETLPEISIIMRYYPDGDMADIKLCEEKRITAIGQTIDCLTFLHERGITHRDIKPANVLVELKPYFKVVLSDFGMCKAITSSTQWLHTFCGTLLYMAPEVFPFSKRAYNSSADVWSVGVMGLKWLYGLPKHPTEPREAWDDVPLKWWQTWANIWVGRLMMQLEDQESGMDIDLLQGMLIERASLRLTARQALNKGFTNGLFKRRAFDGLVECGSAADDINDLASKEAPLKVDPEDNSETTIIMSRLGSPSLTCNSPNVLKAETPTK